LSDPSVCADRKLFQELLTEHARQKKIQSHTQAFYELTSKKTECEELIADAETDPELLEMAQAELGELDEQIPAAERAMTLALLPPDPSDNRNTIVEIRAGTGGDEAALFAGDLYRMYGRFAENAGWKTSVIDASSSEIGGFKEVIFSIEGDAVYQHLKFESGVHRVQRVPVTEASGRIHTSAATVAVMPEADDTDHVDIKPDEIRVDIFRASGPGGQSVNTTDSAVRITHLETGITVQCQDEKSQHRNKDKAMRVLRARLLDKMRADEHSKQADQRRSMIGSGDRSERIRTYNFPQNRLTDHRINLTLYSLDRVMEGELKDLITALQDHDLDMRMKEQLV
jgi:peptide chain release factor 1